jgi:hypothetical protein
VNAAVDSFDKYPDARRDLMKALTQNKRMTNAPRAAKAPVKTSAKTTRRREAQCCAKTSRTVAGCHD